MRILVDTNILLDVLCKRKEFAENSLRIFRLCETRLMTGYISALSIPNIVYIMRKELDRERIKEILHTLTMLFSVVELRETDLLKAAELPFSDYEDAIQSVCASRARADYIVTRNKKDFVNSPVSAVTPDELLNQV